MPEEAFNPEIAPKENIRDVANNLIAAVVEAQEYYPPDKRKAGLERIAQMKPELKQAGLDKITVELMKMMGEENNKLRDGLKKDVDGIKEEALKSGETGALNEAYYQMARFPGIIADSLDPKGGVGPHLIALGVVTSWQAEDMIQSTSTN